MSGNVRLVMARGTPNDGAMGDCEYRVEIVVGRIVFFHHRPGTPIGYMPMLDAMAFAEEISRELDLPVEYPPGLVQ